MPKDNNQSSTSNNQNPQTVVPTMDDTTIPPMINNQQSTVSSEQPTPITSHQSPATDSGSAAPSEDIVMPPIITTSLPRKKFAGGKIIATILGLFLLVGGVGAGIVLVRQNQNPLEKAAPSDCQNENYSGTGTPSTNPGSDISVSLCPPGEYPNGCSQNQGNGNPVDPNSNLYKDPCNTDFCGTLQVDYPNGNFTTYIGDACESGGAGGCWEGKVDCPPGTVINIGQPVNVFCSRNEASAAKPICSTGTAQRQTDVCCGGEDKDGEGTCGNPQFITYNCCPADSPPVCTDTTSTYTKTVLHPTNPTGACWEFDQFGQFRRDTYKSHVDTNCGRRPGRDEETGEPNYACDYIVTCERKVTTCVCGTNTPPPTPAPTAQCQNLKAYPMTGNNEVPLTQAQLSALKSGDQFNLCVQGIKTGGSFDKVRFTINGVLQPEQPMIDRVGTTRQDRFCTVYTIPQTLPNNRTFNIRAEMHHITLGWK